MSQTAHLAAAVQVEGRLEATLDVAAGEIVAIIGPNGAGKSTLLKALAGIEGPAGPVRIGDQDWTSRPIRERSLGFVFQDQALFPHLSARRNVEFGLRARGDDRASASRTAQMLLDRLGVGDLADRLPGQLSGGQAQRVAIARALAPRPDLLLLDEPFAGLDIAVATELRLELARVLDDYAGVTLLVTHDAVDVLTLAHQVVVMEEGRILQRGRPYDVAARPLTDHVARLVGLNVIRSEGRCAAFPPTAVAVSITRPEGSPRHVWSGPVESVVPHGDALRVRVASHPPLIADITAQAAMALGVSPGTPVWLAAKETAMSWYDDLPDRGGSPDQ